MSMPVYIYISLSTYLAIYLSLSLSLSLSRSIGICELKSTLLKGGYIGYYIGFRVWGLNSLKGVI